MPIAEVKAVFHQTEFSTTTRGFFCFKSFDEEELQKTTENFALRRKYGLVENSL